ncbi:substrate-binding domain-containing protein [Paenibacillus alginolyticus]|uniref:Substrate-binding domain-containing protein n=1 Tax=Paenibacillus alginolyticus TaxID=59839 RepID=A0ABT4GK15_9BACL|nr:substrate-binding domain-containing protein [Paenibacillus alginolyticus]MCY9696384.1 substrate-binding domain-containing protein [Paenibacillus alginolyticus]MEC0143163.1 substrate-binding domain-containing protein [Paenibacillus alginolyticus]
MRIRANYAAIAIIVVLLMTTAYLFVSKGMEAKDRPLILIPKTIDPHVEFWRVLNQGVTAAAKEYNSEVKVIGTPSESDIDEQIKLVEEAITLKPKAIILAATDYNRLVPVAQKVIGAGITLVTVDSGLEGDISTSLIATDNYAAGRKAVEAMRRYVKEPATYAIVSFVKRSTTQLDRENGVRDSLKNDPSIQILDTLYSNGSEDKAYEQTKQLLAEHSNIRGIFGLNEVSTVGAARALKELDPEHSIKLVGFDSSMNEIAFLEGGTLQATIVQKPFNMGYLAVKTALQVHNGEKVKASIDTGSEVITKENMYTRENQKLLFPFVEK